MFNLIREANTVARMNGSHKSLLTAAQTAARILRTNVTTVLETEIPSVTSHDLSLWLSVLRDEANDRGMNVNKQQQFVDLAWDMLDNDAHINKLYGAAGEERQAAITKIVKALWQLHKAHSAAQSIVTPTNEEDEQLTPSDDTHIPDEEYPELSGINGAGDVPPDDGVEPVDDDTAQVPSTDDECCDKCGEMECKCDADDVATDNPFPEGTLRHELWNAMMLGKDWPDDSLLVNTPKDPSQGYTTDEEPDHIPDESSHSDRASSDTEESDVPENASEETADDIANRIMGKSKHTEEEEHTEVDPIRKAVTTPGNPLKDALKAIEQEGADAWNKLNIPMNPHPPKSNAHRAWARGMLKRAKDQLGIQDPKPIPAKKPQKRK